MECGGIGRFKHPGTQKDQWIRSSSDATELMDKNNKGMRQDLLPLHIT
jgi:hypothetical protein